MNGAVLAVPGVLSAYTIDNKLSTPVTIGGVTLAPHSLWCCVTGGAAADVATAIWLKASLGCTYQGNTSVTVQDQSAGYSYPYPEYAVNFQTSAALPILFSVVLSNSAAAPPDATTQVQNAVISAFNGEDGGTRATIGSRILATRYTGPVMALGAWATVISLNVGTSAANLNYVDAGIDQQPTVDASDIAVIYA